MIGELIACSLGGVHTCLPKRGCAWACCSRHCRSTKRINPAHQGLPQRLNHRELQNSSSKSQSQTQPLMASAKRHCRGRPLSSRAWNFASAWKMHRHAFRWQERECDARTLPVPTRNNTRSLGQRLLFGKCGDRNQQVLHRP